MKSEQHIQKPPLWLSTVVCLGAALLYVIIRFYIYADKLVPLTYALPLLLGVWHGHRLLHYSQIALFGALAFLNVYLVTGAQFSAEDTAMYGMMVLNIVTVGLVIDQLMVSRDRLWSSNHSLQAANAELETNNEELAARDEEISSQNEELQRQTEELERQAIELQQQAEKLQQQTDDLQQLHEESTSRAQTLQSFLDLTTTPVNENGMRRALDRICEAAASAFGDQAAAALVLRQPQGFAVRGQSGLWPSGSEQAVAEGTSADPFKALVVQEGRTACIEDLSQVAVESKSPWGVAFRSVLASPLRIEGSISGALAMYTRQARAWSAAEFRVLEWLSAQAALVLQTLKLREELDRRGREAEESSRQKTRFLAAVSHDVRNPANAISLMAELIHHAGADPQLAAEVPQLAAGLRSNAKLLVELVSDVLDLSRFDSGKVDLDESVFDPSELIRAEVSQYKSVADAAGLHLAIEGAGQPLRIRTDRMKLARVLGNLVGNAIKFTEVGSVQVTCTRLSDGPVEIRVTDTGVGISPEHLEHIFDEFYQIRNPERDRNKGTGLGLAICKRLVDAIGCSLSVRSQVGQGSEFTLRLPEELVVPVEPGEVSSTAGLEVAHRSLAGVRVLVVEDHETTRHAVAQLLTLYGAVVDQAEDGRAALRHVGHDLHDVVLLDLMLPDMDGREILRRLSTNRPGQLKCVLAVSGDVTEARINEVASLGADGLIAKPIQMDQLIHRIVQQLFRANASDPT